MCYVKKRFCHYKARMFLEKLKRENMKKYAELSVAERKEVYNELLAAYGEYKSKGLNLDLSRGKPNGTQLDISNGLLTVDEHGALILTDRGRTIAQKIYDRHKILQSFFERLGVDPQTADDDACRIEHHISDESLEAIKRFIEEK